MLNKENLLEKAIFVEVQLTGHYKSTRSGQYFKGNLLLGCQSYVISIGIYIDEFEVCNPLGTSRKITAVYWTLLNLPAKCRSTLASIQLALLGKSCDVKRFGFDKFFDPLVKDIGHLEQQGVFVKLLNSNLKGTVFCVCADNLGAYSLAGFQENFQA